MCPASSCTPPPHGGVAEVMKTILVKRYVYMHTMHSINSHTTFKVHYSIVERENFEEFEKLIQNVFTP